MRIRSVLSHSAQALLEGALIATLVVGLMAGTAFAGGRGGGGGKPGGGGGGSLTVRLYTDNNGNGLRNWADQVTFDVSTSNAYPVASVTCSQGGTAVYGASEPMYWPNIWDSHGIFTLRSIAWSGGAADCTALLKGTSNGKVVTLGSTSFHVDA